MERIANNSEVERRKDRLIGRIIDAGEGGIVVKIPSWSQEPALLIGYEIDFQEAGIPIEPDTHFFMRAHLDAEEAEDLGVSDLEYAPPLTEKERKQFEEMGL